MTVYKLQRPMMASSPEGMDQVLAYDRQRTQQHLVPLTRDLRALFGDRLRLYAECEVIDGNFVVGRVVPNRGW